MNLNVGQVGRVVIRGVFEAIGEFHVVFALSAEQR